MKANPLAIAAALLAAGTAANGQPKPPIDGAEPDWVQHFGSRATDWTNRIIELRDGTIVAAGFIDRDDEAAEPDWNVIVQSFEPQGRVRWSQAFGGPGVDAAWAVIEHTDGEFALGGISASPVEKSWDAALTILGDRAGPTGTYRFGGAGDDRATDLIRLSDGNLLLVGQTDSSGAGGIDVFLVKTDPEGREIWRRTHGGESDDRGFLGIPMEDGGAIIAGVTGPRGSYDLLLMRIGNDGREMWRRQIGGDANDATHGLAALADGRILLTGYGSSWGGRDNDISALLFDADGTLLSHHAIGGPGDDRVQFAAADPSGGAWLTGYTKSFSTGWRMLVAKVTAEGEVEPWLGAIGGAGQMNGSAVALARNSDLLLGGYSSVPSGGSQPPDAFVMRLSPSAFTRRTDGVGVRTIVTACQSQGPNRSVCR